MERETKRIKQKERKKDSGQGGWLEKKRQTELKEIRLAQGGIHRDRKKKEKKIASNGPRPNLLSAIVSYLNFRSFKLNWLVN